jgi:hypothetical protein
MVDRSSWVRLIDKRAETKVFVKMDKTIEIHMDSVVSTSVRLRDSTAGHNVDDVRT